MVYQLSPLQPPMHQHCSRYLDVRFIATFGAFANIDQNDLNCRVLLPMYAARAVLLL